MGTITGPRSRLQPGLLMCRLYNAFPPRAAPSISLMAELMEDHIRNHIPDNSKSSEEAADDVIQIVRSYLK